MHIDVLRSLQTVRGAILRRDGAEPNEAVALVGQNGRNTTDVELHSTSFRQWVAAVRILSKNYPFLQDSHVPLWYTGD